VSVGTVVVNSSGQRFWIQPTNDEGFVGFKNLSGGNDDACETMDEIDHERWKVAQKSKPA